MRKSRADCGKSAYALTDGSGSLTVVTTRPETMFGDTAVAVNPEDERYRDIVGKDGHPSHFRKRNPRYYRFLCGKRIGTGCLKVTPAHDVNDYEIDAETIWKASMFLTAMEP